MEKLTGFKPNWASMPGDTITDILNQKKVSLMEFSSMMDSDVNEIKLLLHGYIAINETIAIRLERSIGGSATFWLRREHFYRETIERLKLVEEAKWIKELPVKDMIKFRWINKEIDLVESCLSYFNVPDVWTWRKVYKDVTTIASFRKSTSFKSQPASLSTWIRQGEIQADSLHLELWDPNKFRQSFDRIKRLSRLKDLKSFLPKLISVCAESGVAVVIVPTPHGCAASGAAMFTFSSRPLIILSFRYKTDDHFWFTFFHEASHLLLHGNRGVFVDEDTDVDTIQTEEKEANELASEVLIPQTIRSSYLQVKINEREIKSIANQASVSLGIVVGQLQHQKMIPINHFNAMKKHYDINSFL